MSTPIYNIPFVVQNGVLAHQKSCRFFGCPPNGQILIRSTEEFADAMAHWHDFIQIWYVLDGVYAHTIRDRTEFLSAGDLAIVPPFHRHALSDWQELPFQTVCIEFSMQYLESIMEDAHLRTAFLRPTEFAGAAASFSVPAQLRPWVDECMRRLAAEFAENRSKCLALRREELAKLLRLLAEQALAASVSAADDAWRHFRVMRQAIDYAQAHYQDHVTLEEISKVCQMSRCSFSRLFKEITGNTFCEYLCMVRVMIAAQYLGTTDLSVPEVMRLSGFRTRANFYRIYRYYFGLTPAEARRGRSKERLN